VYEKCREGRRRTLDAGHPEYLRLCLAVAIQHLELGNPAAGLKAAIEGRDGRLRCLGDGEMLQNADL